jgi:two-component system chemotaxis sensor kinase CheA
VPFEQVDRLEKIPSQAIERTAQGMVLQYRGAVLPVSLLGATGIHELPDLGEETKRIPLIVYGKGSRQIGLVIEEIVDVVNVEFAEGRGQSVVDGRVTDIVDLDAIVRRAGLLPDAPEPNRGEAQWNVDNAIAPSM